MQLNYPQTFAVCTVLAVLGAYLFYKGNHFVRKVVARLLELALLPLVLALFAKANTAIERWVLVPLFVVGWGVLTLLAVFGRITQESFKHFGQKKITKHDFKKHLRQIPKTIGVTLFNVAVQPEGTIDCRWHYFDNPMQKAFALNTCPHCAVLDGLEDMDLEHAVSLRNHYDEQVWQGHQVQLAFSIVDKRVVVSDISSQALSGQLDRSKFCHSHVPQASAAY